MRMVWVMSTAHQCSAHPSTFAKNIPYCTATVECSGYCMLGNGVLYRLTIIMIVVQYMHQQYSTDTSSGVEFWHENLNSWRFWYIFGYGGKNDGIYRIILLIKSLGSKEFIRCGWPGNKGEIPHTHTTWPHPHIHGYTACASCLCHWTHRELFPPSINHKMRVRVGV